MDKGEAQLDKLLVLVNSHIIGYKIAPFWVGEVVEGFVIVCMTGDMMQGIVGVTEKFVYSP